jgi:hypothetical protein
LATQKRDNRGEALELPRRSICEPITNGLIEWFIDLGFDSERDGAVAQSNQSEDVALALPRSTRQGDLMLRYGEKKLGAFSENGTDL